MTDYQPSTEDTRTKVDAVVQPQRPLKVGINLPTTEGAIAGKTAKWASRNLESGIDQTVRLLRPSG